MNIVVTGATGFIGKYICGRLKREGHTVIAVGRNSAHIAEVLGTDVTAVAWSEAERLRNLIPESDAVINLAGEQINGEKWTPEFQKKVLQSRLDTTRQIVTSRPKVLVNASAVGYYGGHENNIIREDDEPGDDFLAKVCIAWEEEAEKAVDTGSRVSIIRTGIVLGKDGGPLHSILYPPNSPVSPWKLGLGGPLGSGKQYMPWIHQDDLASLFIWAATNPDVSDVMNGVAPNPVTNNDLTAAISGVVGKPAFVPVPSFALHALLGDFANALLYSQRVLPARAQELGFTWKYPDIFSAMRNLLGDGF